tara:strand:+ start:833 stop:1504 length:672 start_codon:yes stop_codon:yes gene_type:complete
MKIAICFFGYPRFYDLWKDNFENFYDGCDVDFYAHFWEDPDLNKDELLSEFNFKEVIIEKQKEDFCDIPEQTDLSKITKSVFQTISPLYSLKKVGEIIKKFDDEYDFVIVTRTDTGCICDESIKEYEMDKDELYFSYVKGNEWLNTHLDAKWFCASADKILKICEIYDNLTNYLQSDKIPLCHHRLFFHSLREYREKMNMVCVNPSASNGGWVFLRNKTTSEI